MKFHFTFSSFVFGLLLANPFFPQAQQITFKRVSFPEGAYFGLVNGVTQDQQGYMWFVSYANGMHRYDGYKVVTYLNDPSDPHSLASNNLEAVYADHNGIIWAGTQESGLERLDPATGIFTHFTHNKNDSTSLSDDRVTAILEDHEGTIWVGTINGLNKLNQNTGTFTRYKQHANDSTSLSCSQIQVLYEDKRKTLWVGTASFEKNDNTSSKEGGLNRYDKKTGTFTRYLSNASNSNSLIDNRVAAIFEDSKGNFWISTPGDGLHTMNREKGVFRRHRYDPANPERLSGPPREKKVGLDLNLFFIREDAAGTLWIGASGGWITSYDLNTKKTTHYNSFNDDIQAMRAVSGGFTSREGVLWITTWIGTIYQVNPFQSTIRHFTTGSISHSICEDASGKIWTGTFGDGLIQHNRITGSIRRFITEPPGPFTLIDKFVDAIFEASDSTLWIGSEKGLSHYDSKTKIFTHYENALVKHGVQDILEDKPGSLWLATWKGLVHFDIMNEVFMHYPNPENTVSGHESVTTLLKDHSGNIWIGKGQGILDFLDPRTSKRKRFACGSGHVSSIAEDFEHVLWVGTSNGLYKSNSSIDSFSRFTDARVVMSPTTVITAILEDNQKNLWIASSAGILRISSGRNSLSIYNEHQGVDAKGLSFFLMRGVRGRRGEFFFSDKTGYYAFFPEQFMTNATAPQIVISDFQLADQKVKPGKDGVLNVPITQAKEIHLNYNQNTFSFDFAGIHFGSPQDNQHFFMLENLDNTWRKAGTIKNAHYYNVPPGQYIFRVKAANSDGVWAEKVITIIVNPPWWRTWWAYILFSLLFLAALVSFIKWRERILKKEKALLEEKVAIRTRELQQEKEKAETTLTELKATQAQLIESEKIAANSKLQQAMLNERLRISRELHDDIGSTLSGIVLYSHLAESQIESKQIKEAEKSLDTIQQSANDMVNRLHDIVWAVNPEHNSLKNLVQKLEEYAMELAIVKKIRVKVNASESLSELQLSVETCHNIYLLVKEAINNAVKYSEASLLELSVCHSKHVIEFVIRDNGKGFDMATTKKGNGLINMHKRADEAGGKLYVQSAPNEGTCISVKCQIT